MTIAWFSHVLCNRAYRLLEISIFCLLSQENLTLLPIKRIIPDVSRLEDLRASNNSFNLLVAIAASSVFLWRTWRKHLVILYNNLLYFIFYIIIYYDKYQSHDNHASKKITLVLGVSLSLSFFSKDMYVLWKNRKQTYSRNVILIWLLKIKSYSFQIRFIW